MTTPSMTGPLGSAPIRASRLVLAAVMSLLAGSAAAEEDRVPAQLQLPLLAATEDAPASSGIGLRKPKLDWETGEGKSYLIPAFDIVAFDTLLNVFDRNFVDRQTYGSTFDTMRHNLHSAWVFDNDPFSTNQFLHPYQGSMYHGFARSAGLSYWESLLYH